MSTKDQHGFLKAKTILTLAILTLGVMVLLKIVPVQIDMYSFQEFVKEQAMFAHVQKMTAKALRQVILNKAFELNLPVDEKNIEVKKTSKRTYVRVTYTIVVDLPFYTYKSDKEVIGDFQVFSF